MRLFWFCIFIGIRSAAVFACAASDEEQEIHFSRPLLAMSAFGRLTSEQVAEQFYQRNPGSWLIHENEQSRFTDRQAQKYYYTLAILTSNEPQQRPVVSSYRFVSINSDIFSAIDGSPPLINEMEKFPNLVGFAQHHRHRLGQLVGITRSGRSNPPSLD